MPPPSVVQRQLKKLVKDLVDDDEVERALAKTGISEENSILRTCRVDQFGQDVFAFQSGVLLALNTLPKKLATRMSEIFASALSEEFPAVFGNGDIDADSDEQGRGQDMQTKERKTKRTTTTKTYADPDEDDIPGGAYMSENEKPKKKGGFQKGVGPSKLTDKKASVSGAGSSTSAYPELTPPVVTLIKKVLKNIKADESSEVFQYPVDKKEYPEYYEAIERPMDLFTISKNLKDKEGSIYANLGDVLEDLNLIWSNAMSYNQEGSPIYELANSCADLATELVHDHLGPYLPGGVNSGGNKSSKDSGKKRGRPPAGGPSAGDGTGKKKNQEQPDGDGIDEDATVDIMDEDKTDGAVPADVMYPKYSIPTASDEYDDDEGGAEGGSSKKKTLLLPLRIVKKCIETIQKQPLAVDFLHPLDWEAIPHYIDTIDEPMDLETVLKHVKWTKKKNVDTEEILRNVNLIWSNCMAFNVEGSELYIAAKKMEAFSKKLINDSRKGYKMAVMEYKKSGKMGAAASAGDEGVFSSSNSTTINSSKSYRKEDLNENQLKMYKICKKVWNDARSVAFHYLNPDAIPGYRDVISRPIDLHTIQKSIGIYQDETAFHVDMSLVFDNATTYNQQGSDIYESAKVLKQDYISLFIKNFPDSNITLQIDVVGVTADDVQNGSMDIDNIQKTITGSKSGRKKKSTEDMLPEFKRPNFVQEEAEKQVKSNLLDIFDPKMKDIKVNGKWRSVLDIEETLASTRQYTLDAVNAANTAILENAKAEKLNNSITAAAPPSPILHDMESSIEQAILASQIVREICMGNAKKTILRAGGYGKGASCIIGTGMYDILEWGEVKFNGTFNSLYTLYPVGYKVARHMLLGVVPNKNVPTPTPISLAANSPNCIQPISMISPETKQPYSFIPIEMYSEVRVVIDEEAKTPAVNAGWQSKKPFFAVCLPNGTVLASNDSPRKAWDEVVSRVNEIPALLNSKMRRCLAVFNRLCAEPSISPYLEEPVYKRGNKGEKAEYREKVRAPMWLREIHSRIHSAAYENEFDFAWDVRLIFTNAMAFELPSSTQYETARELLKLFDELLCDWVYNPQDRSLDDVAKGPWRNWESLKYFDYDEKDVYVCRKTGKRSVATIKGELSKDFVQCKMCCDQYCIEVAESIVTSNDVSNWLCTRCVEARSEEVTKEVKRDITHSVEAFGGIRFAPVSGFGHGWCQGLEKNLVGKRTNVFYSPLGNRCEGKEMVSNQKILEKSIHEKLLEAREKEYDDRAAGVAVLSNDEEQTEPGLIAIEKIPHFNMPVDHTFVFFGNKDDDQNCDNDQNEALILAGDRCLYHIGEQVQVDTSTDNHPKFKVGTILDIHEDGGYTVQFQNEDGAASSNISTLNNISVTAMRKLSNADPASPTKLFFAASENVSSCCCDMHGYLSVHANFLPATGFFGLHLKEIQTCIEGLPNCSRLPAAYTFRNAKICYDSLLKDIECVRNDKYFAGAAEKVYCEKIDSELQYWKDQRALAEAGDIQMDEESDEDEEQASIVDRGVMSTKPLFLTKDVCTKSDVVMGTNYGEHLLVLWDFLDLSHPIIGEACISFDEMLRSLLPSKVGGCMPTVAQAFYDDIGLLLTHYLLREVRVKCGFDGIKKSNAVTNVYNAEEKWQNLLSYKPLNVFTWPSVVRNALLTTSGELTTDEAYLTAKFPLTGHADVRAEIVCLLCAHPFAIDLLAAIDNRGEILSESILIAQQQYKYQSDTAAADDAATSTKTVFEPYIGSRGQAPKNLNELRARCMWQNGMYQGNYYSSMSSFVDDVLSLLLGYYDFCENGKQADNMTIPVNPDVSDGADADLALLHRREQIDTRKREEGKFHAKTLYFYFQELLQSCGYEKESKMCLDKIPLKFSATFTAMQKAVHTGCCGTKSCGMGWCCACDSNIPTETREDRSQKQFEYSKLFGGRLADAYIQPTSYDYRWDARVLTVNKVRDNCSYEDLEVLRPSREDPSYWHGWYTHRMQCLNNLQKALFTLRTVELDNWDMTEKYNVLVTLQTSCMDSHVMAFLLDGSHEKGYQVATHGSLINVTGEARELPPLNIGIGSKNSSSSIKLQQKKKTALSTQERRIQVEYDKLKQQNVWHPNDSTTLAVVAGVSGSGFQSGAGRKIGTISVLQVKPTVYSHIPEAYFRLGYLQQIIPNANVSAPALTFQSATTTTATITTDTTDTDFVMATEDVEMGTAAPASVPVLADNKQVCFFSGLDASKVSPNEVWVVVPTWMQAAPAVHNFSLGVEISHDPPARMPIEELMQLDPVTKSGQGKVIALECVLVLFAAARLAALKEERSTADRLSVLIAHLTQPDGFYDCKIENDHLSEEDLSKKRGEYLGIDAAGWSYWLPSVQHRYSLKTIGSQVIQREGRKDCIEHEPSLLIKNSEGNWLYLETGCRPDGFLRLLAILQSSTSARERKLRITLVERLAHCMRLVWLQGLFRIKNLSFLLLDKRFRLEKELADMIEADEMSCAWQKTGDATVVNAFNNRIELAQARVYEVRSLSLLAWHHRDESDIDPRKAGTFKVAGTEHAFQNKRERECHRKHAFDTLDYHPTKGYYRNDIINRVRQLQPVTMASRISSEPQFAEVVRYCLRVRDMTIEDQYAVEHIIPYVGSLPPASVLGIPGLDTQLLQDIFEAPAKNLDSALHRLEQVKMKMEAEAEAEAEKQRHLSEAAAVPASASIDADSKKIPATKNGDDAMDSENSSGDDDDDDDDDDDSADAKVSFSNIEEELPTWKSNYEVENGDREALISTLTNRKILTYTLVSVAAAESEQEQENAVVPAQVEKDIEVNESTSAVAAEGSTEYAIQEEKDQTSQAAVEMELDMKIDVEVESNTAGMTATDIDTDMGADVNKNGAANDDEGQAEGEVEAVDEVMGDNGHVKIEIEQQQQLLPTVSTIHTANASTDDSGDIDYCVSAPSPSTAAEYDLMQADWCGYGRLQGIDSYCGGRMTAGTGVSYIHKRRYAKIVELRHMLTKGFLRIFESQKHAAEFFNVSQSGISLCCNRKQADAYGFRWEFYEGPPLDFDVIHTANFQLPLHELMKLKVNNKELAKTGVTVGAQVASGQHQQVRSTASVTGVRLSTSGSRTGSNTLITPTSPRDKTYVPVDTNEIVDLADIPRDVNPVAPSSHIINQFNYRITNPIDGQKSIHRFPNMTIVPVPVEIAKPQLTLSKHREKHARMLILKSELIGLLNLLPEERLTPEVKQQEYVRTVVQEAAEADASPTSDCAVWTATASSTAQASTSTSRGEGKRQRGPDEDLDKGAGAEGEDDITEPPKKALKAEENVVAVECATASVLPDAQTSRSVAIENLTESIRSAKTPEQLMQCVFLVEECIPVSLRRMYHRWALPFDTTTLANIATRIYGIDRFVKYDMCSDADLQSSVVSKSFAPRYTFEPRCMSSHTCALPFFHVGQCQPNTYYQVVCGINGKLNAIPSGTRHSDIIDCSGNFFCPPQGIKQTKEQLVFMYNEFQIKYQAIITDRLEKQKEHEMKLFKERQAAEKRARDMRAEMRTSDDEDEFSEGGRPKTDRKAKLKIDIEYVIPYKPSVDEIEEFYDI